MTKVIYKSPAGASTEVPCCIVVSGGPSYYKEQFMESPWYRDNARPHAFHIPKALRDIDSQLRRFVIYLLNGK